MHVNAIVISSFDVKRVSGIFLIDHGFSNSLITHCYWPALREVLSGQ